MSPRAKPAQGPGTSRRDLRHDETQSPRSSGGDGLVAEEDAEPASDLHAQRVGGASYDCAETIEALSMTATAGTNAYARRIIRYFHRGGGRPYRMRAASDRPGGGGAAADRHHGKGSTAFFAGAARRLSVEKTMHRPFLGPSVACLALLIATHAEGQALRYVDEYGVVHWVKSKDQIPEKYRDKVEKPSVPGVNAPPRPRSYKQDIVDICERDTSLHTKMQCEAWMRREEQEQQRRVREVEMEQKRREQQAEYEQKRREREAEFEQKRREREAEREQWRQRSGQSR